MSTALEQRPVIVAGQAQAPAVNAEIYSDPNARKILQFMLRSPRTPITPEILPTDELHYPQLRSVVDEKPSAMVDLLSRMVSAKALVADLVDKTPACPECGSTEVSTRYTCPKCFSFDISRSFLFEHLKCGKVASDDTFRKGEQLVCPKCQAVLHNFGVEYRAVGAWYQCKNCNESFNAPTSSHFCRPLKHQFSMDRTRLVPIYQYRLNPETLAAVRKEVLMYNDAVTMLESRGLSVEAPYELLGKSGQPQSFDMVTTIKGGRWSGNKTVAIDVPTSHENISMEQVRDFAAKVRDARPGEAYLIAVPGLSEDARTLSKNLKLSVVEGPTVKEAMASLLSRDTFKGLSA
jgi:transposase-like protein